MKELEERRFVFHLLKFSVADLLTISIVPLIKQDDGSEIIGNTLGTYSVKSGNYNAGTTTPTTCTPTTCSTLGYNCGTQPNGTCSGSTLNCGTCSSGFVCTSGICVAEGTTCTPTTCSALGYNCGTAANGTCAGSLSCGSCGTGQTCVSGVCQTGATCTGTTCSALGYTCGTHQNGSCSTTLNCGTCGTGYSCVGGSCVVSLYNCNDANILCVDDTAGSTQEYLTIQACADVVQPGQTCLVYPGTYNAVRTIRSGTSANRITFRALNSATIYNSPGINIIPQTQDLSLVQGETSSTLAYAFGAIIIEHNYITVDGFDISYTPSNCFREGIIILGAYSEVKNNHIHDILGGFGMSDRGNNNHIVYNKITRTNKGIELHGNQSLTEYNDFSRMIYNCQDADFVRAYGSNHTIRYNYFHDNRAEDFNLSLTHPDLIQTMGSAKGAYNISFEHNFAINLQNTQVANLEAQGTGIGEISNWIFKNNIFYNISGQATMWIPYSKFYRNTFYYVTPTAVTLQFRGSTSYGYANYSEVKNNLFIDAGVDSKNSIYAVESSIIGFVGDYNYIASHPPDYSTKTYWTDPVEINGINGGDPLFANINNPLGPDGIPWTNDDGFRLQSGSPACGGGENGEDIGAYDC